MPYLFPLTSWIPIPAWQDFVHAKQRVHEFGATAVRQYIAENGREESSGRMDILQKVTKNACSCAILFLTASRSSP